MTGRVGHVVVWEFEVEPHNRSTFEQIYGPCGDWAQLFRSAEGYEGTTLLKDAGSPGRYLTIDRWTDATAYLAFRAASAVEYEALDRRCEALTTSERPLGDAQSQGPGTQKIQTCAASPGSTITVCSVESPKQLSSG